jgi:hypothetical protein
MAGSAAEVEAHPLYVGFSHTEMWLKLPLVKRARCQLLQRSRRVIPASRAMRSSSDGQT